MRKHSRKSIVVAVIIGALALSTAALAAWIIYSGLGGSAGGTFSSATSSASALTYSDTGTAATALTPSSSTTVNVKITNSDPNIAHTVSTLTSTFTTTPTDCAAHLTIGTVTGVGGGTVVAAGGSVTGTIAVNADATLPADCVGGTFVMTFAGTTT